MVIYSNGRMWIRFLCFPVFCYLPTVCTARNMEELLLNRTILELNIYGHRVDGEGAIDYDRDWQQIYGGTVDIELNIHSARNIERKQHWLIKLMVPTYTVDPGYETGSVNQLQHLHGSRSVIRGTSCILNWIRLKIQVYV